MAVLVAALASSVLGFVILLITSQFSPTGSKKWLTNPGYVAATAAIVVIWAPAFALIPAALLGYFVERPKARWLIANDGGIAIHLLLSVIAALVLSVLFRIVLHLIDTKYPLFDPFGLGLFAIVGVGSALAWWFVVIVPERRA